MSKPLNNGPFGMYRMARAVVNIIQRASFRVEFIGRENVPMDGSILVCSNHQSNWDPVLLASAIPKQRPLRFFAKKELFSVPVLKHILKRAGQIPVSRGEGDRQALRVVLQKLKEDEVIKSVTFTAPKSGAYAKFPNPASRYAMAGVFVADHGKKDIRVGVTGASSGGVYRAKDMEKALAADMSADALDGCTVDEGDMLSDIHGSAAYRANLVKVMAKRAVAAMD